jgi:hypothetical protein
MNPFKSGGSSIMDKSATAQVPSPAWIQRSNENAQVLLEVMARFAPEVAGFYGVTGLDTQVMDLREGIYERSLEANRKALAELRGHLDGEKDAAVRQDLEILITRTEENIEGAELEYRLMLPYFNLSHTIFEGMRTLLDHQVEPERRAAALVRLRRYAGLDEGYEPIAQLAEARIRERLGEPGLLGPTKAEIEKDLSTTGQIIGGIGPLFDEYEVPGYEGAYEALKGQLAAYESFIRAEVLPRARDDFRQPAELYAHGLKQFGVDFSVEEMVSRARVSFKELQNEMQALARLVSRERGFSVTDYRDVIRELKKKQIIGEDILPHYQNRIKDLEKIIVEQDIVTLPDRPMQIELASEAESAALPAPHMKPPRMIGNTGEKGTFVLPLRIPAADGKESLGFDDFTFESASWTLTAHEGRPGHELQFASMVEAGVSIPRALFAFNSVNVEGWALYCEAEMKPYLPLDGQLIACQHRLLRAARAFLDPGLQMGTFSKEEATRILIEEVCVSEAMALQEVERYTFRMPGQATSYFCGYQRIMDLRSEMERVLGDKFDRKALHDFMLAQGLLPAGLLRQAVLEEFVPRYK